MLHAVDRRQQQSGREQEKKHTGAVARISLATHKCTVPRWGAALAHCFHASAAPSRIAAAARVVATTRAAGAAAGARWPAAPSLFMGMGCLPHQLPAGHTRPPVSLSMVRTAGEEVRNLPIVIISSFGREGLQAALEGTALRSSSLGMRSGGSLRRGCSSTPSPPSSEP